MTQFERNPNPLLALSCLYKGIKLLAHPKLRKFILIPLGINLIVYTSLMVAAFYGLSHLLTLLIPSYLHWLNWLLWPIFSISILLIASFSFSLLANLFASPFYSQLSDQCLELICDSPVSKIELPWKKVVLGESKRCVYLLKQQAPLLLLSLIPVINLLSTFLWGLFSAWGSAMEYLAYPLETRGLTFDEQKQFIHKNKLSMLVFGGVVNLGLAVPIINLLIGQAAVIGATLYVQGLVVESEA